MTSEQMLDVVREVIEETFLVDDEEVTRETTALDVPGWDSLSHTIVLLAIEDRLRLRLRGAPDFCNVGELVDFLVKQTADKGSE